MYHNGETAGYRKEALAMDFRDFIVLTIPSAQKVAEADGNEELIKIKYESTYLEVTFYPLEPGRPPKVCSDIVVAPAEGTTRNEFFRAVLDFNRKALGVLEASFKPTTALGNTFALTWHPSEGPKTKKRWQTEVRIFSKLFAEFHFDPDQSAAPDVSRQHYIRL